MKKLQIILDILISLFYNIIINLLFIYMKKEKKIYDCKNSSGVIYPSNKCVGDISFINCDNVKGIEFDRAMKVTGIDISNMPLIKYINIQHTNIKKLTAPIDCMVYCKNDVIIIRI